MSGKKKNAFMVAVEAEKNSDVWGNEEERGKNQNSHFPPSPYFYKIHPTKSPKEYSSTIRHD